MKTTALRLNNLVLFEGKEQYIAQINTDNTIRLKETIDSKESHGCYSINQVESIILNKESFLKLGVSECSGTLYLSITNLKSELHFEIYDSEIITYLKGPFCDLILDPIKYVHQLQNLVFALTGEELQFNK